MRKDLFVEFPILLPEFILIIGTTCQLVPRPFLNSLQTEQQADGYHGVESMKPCVEITNLLGRASRPEADLILVHWRGIFLISQEKKKKKKESQCELSPVLCLKHFILSNGWFTKPHSLIMWTGAFSSLLSIEFNTMSYSKHLVYILWQQWREICNCF